MMLPEQYKVMYDRLPAVTEAVEARLIPLLHDACANHMAFRPRVLCKSPEGLLNTDPSGCSQNKSIACTTGFTAVTEAAEARLPPEFHDACTNHMTLRQGKLRKSMLDSQALFSSLQVVMEYFPGLKRSC